MRVDIDRLDSLLNLTGELVVSRARLAQVAGEVGADLKKRSLVSRAGDLKGVLDETLKYLEGLDEIDDELQRNVDELRGGLDWANQQHEAWTEVSRGFGQILEAIDQLTRISDGIQHSVLETRMVPVGPLFNRFGRVVRDLSKERGKKVTLEIHGEKTELDKRMVDELGDPLMHLVRNAVDHGLESPEVRAERGKPEGGTLSLRATPSGNHVLVSIQDDGGGVDVDRLKRRLHERGILDQSKLHELTDEQVIEYIWHPGFSTAEEITDVSGRGVGMDAVRTRIGELNGTIEIDSVAGEGAVFTIRLPLTLAIINCLLIRVRDVTFSLPIENVREIVTVSPDNVVTIHHRHTIDVRDELIPLLRIEDIFDWRTFEQVAGEHVAEEASSGDGSVNAVILRIGEQVLALRVNKFLGSQDTVTKSLSENFMPIRGLSGASILGDGSVCLMLDVASILGLAGDARSRDAVRSQPSD